MEPLVALVRRVHRDGDIAEHRLDTGCSDDDLLAAAALERVRKADDDAKLHGRLVTGHRQQRGAGDIDVVNFNVGDRGFELAAPVDKAIVSVDEAVLRRRAREWVGEQGAGEKVEGGGGGGFEVQEDASNNLCANVARGVLLSSLNRGGGGGARRQVMGVPTPPVCNSYPTSPMFNIT